jgi:hypothetical protein
VLIKGLEVDAKRVGTVKILISGTVVHIEKRKENINDLHLHDY